MSESDSILLYRPEAPSKSVKVSTYERWVSASPPARAEIAEFVYERHYRRYLKPFKFPGPRFRREFKNGFAMMATSCLLIETLESFYRGWATRRDKSKCAFLKFFTRDKRFSEFATNDIPSQFYKHVRCGILHQGETTGGWHISRRNADPILREKRINANKFLLTLGKSLADYRDLLGRSDWQSSQWQNLRTKMKAVIKNCKA